ncbi:uncharacterized protein WCC33_010980 [Rhinophrynus dorsalis]
MSSETCASPLSVVSHLSLRTDGKQLYTEKPRPVPEMDPRSVTRLSPLLLLALAAASVIVEAENPQDKKLTISAQNEVGKGKTNPSQPIRFAQRGRKKSIWSYKPGHRSLAFLTAGDVELATPPPGQLYPGVELRCLGCCGAGETYSIRQRNSVLRTEDIAGMGIESNAIPDLCLGCCDEFVTPFSEIPEQTTVQSAAAPGTVRRTETTVRQHSWTDPREKNNETPCVHQGCISEGSSESQSSSEEVPRARRTHRMRSQVRPPQGRMGDACRYLGCRSPLGSFSDSSSEED